MQLEFALRQHQQAQTQDHKVPKKKKKKVYPTDSRSDAAAVTAELMSSLPSQTQSPSSHSRRFCKFRDLRDRWQAIILYSTLVFTYMLALFLFEQLARAHAINVSFNSTYTEMSTVLDIPRKVLQGTLTSRNLFNSQLNSYRYRYRIWHWQQ